MPSSGASGNSIALKDQLWVLISTGYLSTCPTQPTATLRLRTFENLSVATVLCAWSFFFWWLVGARHAALDALLPLEPTLCSVDLTGVPTVDITVFQMMPNVDVTGNIAVFV